MKTEIIELLSIQPSQLYICEEKLKAVQMKGIFKPVPIKKLDNKIIFTDGHSTKVKSISRDIEI